MGQYHMTVNLDKGEYLHPHQLGDGLKLMEQAYSSGGIGTALILLLGVSNGRGGGDFNEPGHDDVIGRWGGDRIVIIGDYAEKGDYKQRPGDPNPAILYSLCTDDEAQVKGAARYWRELAERADECGGEMYGNTAEGWREMADEAERFGPLTDITPMVRKAIAAEGFIAFTEGDGWITRKRVA